MPNVPFKFRRVLLDVNVCIALLFLLFLAVSSKPEGISPPPSPAGTIAIPANEFLNSIGVCSSITGRGETLAGTTEALSYTGIRFIQCGLEDRISVPDMSAMHKKTGARYAYGLLSGGTDLDRLLIEARQLASADALLALEVNNEPNNWGITYQQEKGGRNLSWLPVAKLQRDLYKAVKNDALGYPFSHMRSRFQQVLSNPNGIDQLIYSALTITEKVGSISGTP